MQELQAWRRSFGPELVGEAPKFLEALQVLKCVSECDSTIVITGETGTGKDLLARTAHRASGRRGKFIPVNCAALQDSLVEAELFGHVRGAFTGAHQAREGRFLAAHGGTLFLDEIGELSPSAQAKVLRVLEDRMVTPVGSDVSVPVDVRLVAATHRNLAEMVQDGSFRADLYFRLCVVEIDLPPLRERGDDIDRITDVMVARLSERLGKSVLGIDKDAREQLRAQPWPGNVRELCFCLERTVLMASPGPLTVEALRLPQVRKSSPRINPGAQSAALTRALGALQGPGAEARALLGDSLDPRPGAQRRTQPPSAGESDSLDLRAALEAVERFMIGQAMDAARGNRTEAAAILGLNRTTLVEKLRKYGV
jgi:transcriptional regulator with PAS, ATPase and Fis domain